MANEKRLLFDSEFKLRINAVIANRKRMGLPYDQLENVALGLLDCCPTVDAVEVVRCKDCRCAYINSFSAASGVAVCKHWSNEAKTVIVQQDDFCSYGERREGE